MQIPGDKDVLDTLTAIVGDGVLTEEHHALSAMMRERHVIEAITEGDPILHRMGLNVPDALADGDVIGLGIPLTDYVAVLMTYFQIGLHTGLRIREGR